MQHVWAETLHDRTYKSGIVLPKPLLRESFRIAALLEKADQDLLRLSGQIDAFSKDHVVHLDNQAFERELDIARSLADQRRLQPKEKAKQVLRLLSLLASARRWSEIVGSETLRACDASPAFLDAFDHLHSVALCRIHRDEPSGGRYRKGIGTLARLARPIDTAGLERNEVGAHLEAVLERLSASGDGTVVRDAARSLAMADFAWACHGDLENPDHRKAACDAMLQAHLLNTDDPYIYGDLVWFQLENAEDRSFLHFAWSAIEAAMATCRMHLLVGLDGNRIWATLGRFHLVRGEWNKAAQAFARLIAGATSPEVLLDEHLLLRESARVHAGKLLGPHLEQILRTLDLAIRVRGLPEVQIKYVRTLVVAGTCNAERSAEIEAFRPVVVESIRAFEGLVVAGATTTGVAGMVGDAFLEGARQAQLVGFAPALGTVGLEVHPAYRIVHYGQRPGFGTESVLQYWEFLLEQGISPCEVRILGVGGGDISRFEYDLAVALGAVVGLVRHSGGEADRLLGEVPWWPQGAVIDLIDHDMVRLFCRHRSGTHSPTAPWVPLVAEKIHERYLESPIKEENRRPWKELSSQYKDANLDQATTMDLLLRRQGLEIQPLAQADPTSPIRDLVAFLGAKAFEDLCRMEHSRWCLEREKAGWHWAKFRDEEQRLHPCLVPWEALTEKARGFDLDTVSKWPKFLESCGLGIFPSGAGTPEIPTKS